MVGMVGMVGIVSNYKVVSVGGIVGSSTAYLISFNLTTNSFKKRFLYKLWVIIFGLLFGMEYIVKNRYNILPKLFCLYIFFISSLEYVFFCNLILTILCNCLKNSIKCALVIIFLV